MRPNKALRKAFRKSVKWEPMLKAIETFVADRDRIVIKKSMGSRAVKVIIECIFEWNYQKEAFG